MLLATPAYADTTIALGTVLRRQPEDPDMLGLRGLLAGGLAHVAFERFQPQGTSQTRTRAEIGLHLKFSPFAGLSIEPSLALAPFDMTQHADGTKVFVVSAVSGLRFSARVWGVFGIFVEPVRVEGRLLMVTIQSESDDGPILDRSFVRDYSSSAGISVTW